MTSRVAPLAAKQVVVPDMTQQGQQPREIYQLTKERLDEIRKEKMYPFFDYDLNGKRADLVSEVNDNSAQVHKQLNFLLPYYGFGFNYTWVRARAVRFAHFTGSKRRSLCLNIKSISGR